MSLAPPSVAWSELAPSLKSRRRLLPCGWLGRWLTGDMRNPRSAAAHAQVLMLAAFEYRLASVLLEDWGLSAAATEGRRWRQWTPRLRPSPVFVPAGRLSFPPMIDGSCPRPMRKTERVLRNLPASLVRAAVAWAPPIVQPPVRSGQHRVIANALPSLVARRIAPDCPIEVRILDGRAPLPHSLGDLLAATAASLSPIFEANRVRVVREAADLAEAMSLSGYSRARCAELRAEQ